MAYKTFSQKITMNILWITNNLFPDVCASLGVKSPESGGWMHASALSILENKGDIKFAVASVYDGKELKALEIGGVTYYLLPRTKNNRTYDLKLEKNWKHIKREFQPSIVHIHGTEYPHGLAYLRACGSDSVVISIQGLVSVIERYYYANISKWNIVKNITIRDLIKSDTIFNQRKNMKKRGYYEKEVLLAAKNIIGRTLWDKAHIWANNPTARYHFCNETLRPIFYQHQWIYEKCEKNSIFISQACSPIKGVHQIIQALPLIIKHHPETKVYVAGNDFTNKSRWRLGGYGKLIKTLIKNLRLENHITFTGPLSEKDMCQRLMKAHVFVSPSSIENSSNSISEAQLLGVPCVASYVGGIEDMVKNNETGLLYRFEEIEMLAKIVCTIFTDHKLTQKISDNAKIIARVRHNKELNRNRILEIYSNICKNISQ